MTNPDVVTCPSCNRRFAVGPDGLIAALQAHIAICPPSRMEAALRKIRDTLRRPDLGPGTTLRIISETVDKALPQEPT